MVSTDHLQTRLKIRLVHNLPFTRVLCRIAIVFLSSLNFAAALLAMEPAQEGRLPDRNAALDYWNGVECLVAHLPDDGTPHDVHFAYLDRLAKGHVTRLDEQTSKDAEKAGVALFFLHRGGRAANCDWQLAFDDLGPNDEQGHIAQVPYLVGAAYLRARWLFEQRRDEEATKDLLAVLRLAYHVGHDGRDGTKAVLYQLTTEQRVLEIVASHVYCMNSGQTKQISKSLTSASVPQVLKNWITTQQAVWIEWPRRFAGCAKAHNGNWNAYWEELSLSSPFRREVGDLLRAEVKEIPDDLTTLADDANVALRQALRMTDLSADELRLQWREELKKAADRNLILSLAGGELEPIHSGLLAAQARRDLFQAGLVVLEHGFESLEKEPPRSCGTIIHHKQDQGFRLETAREIGGRIQSLTFVTAPAKP